MAEYVPIPFEEWKRANPDLCEEYLCAECEGTGTLFEAEVGPPPFEAVEDVAMVACPHCDGGKVSDAGANYLARLEADREKWDAALRRTG